MTEKILKIIKAFIIPMAIIGLILFVLLINKSLLELVNSKHPDKHINTVKEPKIKHIEGTLIKAIDTPREKNSLLAQNQEISKKTKIDYAQNDDLINQYFYLKDESAQAKLGANIHWAFREDPCRDVLLNDAIYQGNIKFAREEFNWESIEPIRGKKDYSRHDEILKNYRHFDVEVLGLLAYSTKWSAQSPSSASNKEFYPPNLDQWNSFVRETATRYKGQVSAWEVWNEPNDPNFFKGTRTQYYELLKTTYKTIKSADPNAKIVSGGITWPDPAYTYDFFEAGMHNYIDGYGIHAYYCEQGMTDGHYEKLASDLAKNIQITSKYRKPIWITEFGCSSFSIGQKKQADNLAYMMTLFNSSPQIERAYWYALRDTGHTGKEGEYGLINKNFVLKQSFQAFKYFSP